MSLRLGSMIPGYDPLVYCRRKNAMGPLRFERRTARFLIGTDDNYEPSALTWLSYGPANAANRARTCDIMVNSHALYQLSYSGLHNNHGGET